MIMTKLTTLLVTGILTTICMSCSQQDNNTVLPDVSIDASSYETPKAYGSGAPASYTYDAKVLQDSIHIHMTQTISEQQAQAYIEVDVMDEALLGPDTPLKIKAYADNTAEIPKIDCIDGHSLIVKREGKNIEYLLKIKCSRDLSGLTRMKFYSYDPVKKTRYNDHDLVVTSSGNKLHTHAGKGWYVSSRIGFKPESLYLLPGAAQVPLPDKWGFTASAEDEGLYIYAYQKHRYTEGKNKWSSTSHMEFSLYQHNIGYGPTDGFNKETYIALWKSGDASINNMTNILAYELNTTLTEEMTEYRFFIRFNNNFDNPQDGPYAMIKPRSFDPGDNRRPYSYEDIVEFRDNRFVHTTKGSSYMFNRTLNKVINHYEEDWLQNKVNDFRNHGLEDKENLTLFIGDSFFDVGWWENFYTDYCGKAAHTAAIGGTTTWQWLNWTESLIKTFDKNLKNIIIHLGYNDLNYTNNGVTAEEIEFYTERFINLLHSIYPDANIFYCGIGTSEWFAVKPEKRAKTCDALAKAFCESRSYVTFVDMDAAYARYMEETGGNLNSFFKDRTHPKNENYKYLMEQITLAGCVIE